MSDEIDTSEDEHLTEKDAIAQAAEQGIYFKDVYQVQDEEEVYETRADAEAAASKLKGDHNIIQIRTRI